MAFEGEAARVIEEQRKQLMQLREENQKLKSGTIPVDDAKQLMTGFERAADGRTLGLKIADGMRMRLSHQQERLAGKSYRQMVQVCIELGLRNLEGLDVPKVRAVGSSAFGA